MSDPEAQEGTETFAFPLSFAQQRLWFLDQWQPGNPAYNLPTLYRLTGPVNVSALEGALNEIVARHEILRTTYEAGEDGTPVQVVHPYRPFTLPVSDLTALPAAEREAQATALARVEAGAAFDLAKGPVFRARLLRLGPEDHRFAFTVHHIAFDGWSVGLLAQELEEAYSALSRGASPALSEVPLQYADYACWQRDVLDANGFAAPLAYWETQLQGLQPLDLPTDRPRPPEQSFRGARRAFTVPPAVAARLKTLAAREGATLFMTLLAGYQALLHRYTGQEDVAVGTPIAGREDPKVARVMGFFVNTLVMRGDLSGNPSFRELLKRTRATSVQAYANQSVPFDMLVTRLQPERDPSRSPLFQVMLTVETVTDSRPAPGGLGLHPLDPDLDV
ncbi:MAG TPA: condensation domain-containing protein, partial [Candidatus Thermoplasmatota archaeon]|nr:condensation domain-containing protein [Candidatus Thermoplasmatota archaeon]